MPKFRFSHSLIKKHKNCPFSLFCKVTNQSQDAEQNQSYGDAGNVVHHVAEYYFTHLLQLNPDDAINELKSYFEILWADADINNIHINKDEYWLSVINILKLNIFPTDFEFEGKLMLGDIEVVSYMDIIDRNNHIIGDWKTSTFKSSKLEEYKEQLKLYSYIYLKIFGQVPSCFVFFTKSNKIFKFKFTEATLMLQEKMILDQAKEIEQEFKTMNFERRPSRTNCFFCPYKETCSTDLLRKSESPYYEIIFSLKKNKLLIEGAIPDIIHRKIEHECNFEIKNAHFIIAAMKAKGVHIDGIKRLYRRRDFGGETLIGFMRTAHSILKDYAISQGMKLKLTLKDYRNPEIMNQTHLWDNKEPLKIDFEMYDFQNEAVRTLLSNRWGICEIGTGGGKTVIAAECIRQVATKTLFVIDNKDLLMQTKDEYEAMLGIECGIVGMGQEDWSKPVTLATIQTLAKHVKEFAPQLSRINMVIYDETHIIAVKSFETLSKYLINTKYRLGFSATAKRDDGADKLIYAHTGEVVYKRNALRLIQDDVLVNPNSIFYEYSTGAVVSDTWQNEYMDGIVNNEERNRIIAEIAIKHYPDKQVMILCKMIKHCEQLKDMIPDSDLIYGQTEDEVRYETMESFRKGTLRVLIGNLKIFNKGINLKNLDVLINAAGNAGEVVTIQTIGRTMRKNPGKTESHYIDFMDKGEYLKKHSKSRIDALETEGYKIKIEKYINIEN